MSEAPEAMGWQQDLIATNLLMLGYNAWAGYPSGERGALICSTNPPPEKFIHHATPMLRAIV